MKRTITFFSLILVVSGLFSQAPHKLSFQAVVRNSNGELLKNSTVGFRIQILQSTEFGAALYVETHETACNENGLVTLEIGDGTVVTGKFDTIDWKKGPYFLKTEIDPAGGTNYTITGTSQLLSVPFALYAQTTSLPDGIIRLSSTPGAGDLLLFDGADWKVLPKGNDGQVLTMVNGLPSWKDVPLISPILSIERYFQVTLDL